MNAPIAPLSPIVSVTTASDYSEVFDTCSSYLEARANGRLNKCPIVHQHWTWRTLEDRNVISIGRGDPVLKRALAGSQFLQPQMTSIETFCGDLAIARIDDWQSAAASYISLLKQGSDWYVVGESYAAAARCGLAERYNPANSDMSPMQVLGTYYRAVDEDDASALEGIFDVNWRMKNLEDGLIVSEDKKTFQARLGEGKHLGYARNRQIAAVQHIYNHLAYMRIDQVRGSGITCFMFFKCGGTWLIVDKIFAVAQRK